VKPSHVKPSEVRPLVLIKPRGGCSPFAMPPLAAVAAFRLRDRQPCSFDLSATSQQYFSLKINQPSPTNQQYFSLRTNQHQPSTTSRTNRLVITSKEIGHHEVQVDASMIAIAVPREPLRRSVAAPGARIRSGLRLSQCRQAETPALLFVRRRNKVLFEVVGRALPCVPAAYTMVISVAFFGAPRSGSGEGSERRRQRRPAWCASTDDIEPWVFKASRALPLVRSNY
jgi:hypothetical protein